MSGDPVRLVSQCDSVPSLWKRMVRFCQGEGFRAGAYYLLGRSIPSPAMKPQSFGFPRAVQQRYLSLDYRRLDVVPRVAIAKGSSVTWQEAWESATLTQEEREFWIAIQDQIRGPGLGFPCYGPRGVFAYVALAGFAKGRTFSDDYLHYLQYVFQAGHLHLCSMLALGEKVPHLSIREKEVLTLVSVGKSNSVIGELLNISANTVDTHLRRIYNKMGVADRTSAAIKAVGGGIIPS